MQRPDSRAIALLTLAMLLSGRTAYAYLDPGTGSYVFQMVAAAVITLGFLIRSFWHRFREALRRLLGRTGDGARSG